MTPKTLIRLAQALVLTAALAALVTPAVALAGSNGADVFERYAAAHPYGQGVLAQQAQVPSDRRSPDTLAAASAVQTQAGRRALARHPRRRKRRPADAGFDRHALARHVRRDAAAAAGRLRALERLRLGRCRHRRRDRAACAPLRDGRAVAAPPPCGTGCKRPERRSPPKRRAGHTARPPSFRPQPPK